MPADITILDWITRLVVAAFLSGLVGFERETRQKAAGLRTHMLVGLGAALFTLVGAYALGGDPARVAAQIVTGVGFLGAGAIFRDGATVKGLTTAAGLWAVAAIGMATGAGLIAGAISATIVALLILVGLGLMEARVRRRRMAESTRMLGVTLADLTELNKVVKLASRLDEEARHVGIDPVDESGFVLTFQIKADRMPMVTAALMVFDSVVEVAEMDSE